MNFSKEKKGFYFVIIISIVIIAFVLGNDFDGVINVLSNIKIKWIILSFSMMIIYWLLEAIIYKLFFIKSFIKIKFIELFKVVLIVQFFNGVTPFATGGQPFQVYVLNKKVDASYGKIVSITMQHYIIYQIALVIYSSIAILYNIYQGESLVYFNNKIKLLIFFGYIANLILILFFIIILKSKRVSNLIVMFILKVLYKINIIKNIEDSKIKAFKMLEEFRNNEKELSKNKKLFIITIIINIIKSIIYFGISYILCLSVGVNTISFIAIQLASCYTYLVTSMFPLPGASGGAEIGFLAFFANIISGSIASAIMILWRFFTYYFGVFLGFIFTVHELRKIIIKKEN